MKKLLSLAIMAGFILSSQSFAIEEAKKTPHCNCEHHNHLNKKDITVTDSSTLTVLDCISIGLKNSPVIKEAAYRLEIAKSEVGSAKASYFPEISAGVGFRQENNSNRADFYQDYRELPTVGIALNKMIWDFGRTTANIRMRDFLKIAAEYEFEDTVCATVFNIKMHYYKLLKTKAEYDEIQSITKLQETLIKEIKNLKKPRADLLIAEVEYNKRKADVLRMEDEYKNAMEALNNAMFFENAPKYDIFETQTFVYKPTQQTSFKNITYKKEEKISKDSTIFEHPTYSYNNAVELAYKNSPDIHALAATKDAMAQALLFVKRSYYPELNAGVGYDFIKSNKFKNNGLTVAVGMDASLNAMRQKYDVRGAQAQLDLADTEITTFKKNLYFTVRKSVNTLETAYNNLPISKSQMDKAAENFNETYKNYKSNTMNEVDMQYAMTLYHEALLNHINAQYEYNTALIRLEMAMHEHIIDYHDDAEHAVEYHEGDENNTLWKLIRCNKKHKVNL